MQQILFSKSLIFLLTNMMPTFPFHLFRRGARLSENFINALKWGYGWTTQAPCWWYQRASHLLLKWACLTWLSLCWTEIISWEILFCLALFWILRILDEFSANTQFLWMATSHLVSIAEGTVFSRWSYELRLSNSMPSSSPVVCIWVY